MELVKLVWRWLRSIGGYRALSAPSHRLVVIELVELLRRLWSPIGSYRARSEVIEVVRR